MPPTSPTGGPLQRSAAAMKDFLRALTAKSKTPLDAEAYAARLGDAEQKRAELQAQRAQAVALWKAREIADRGPEERAAHKEELAAIDVHLENLDDVVTELQELHAAAVERERRDGERARIERFRARRRETRKALHDLEKHLKAVGAGLSAVRDAYNEDQNELRDLEKLGYSTDEIAGGDPDATFPPGALRLHRGALLWDLLPDVPSVLAVAPHFGNCHGEDPEQRERERQALDAQIAQSRRDIAARRARAEREADPIVFRPSNAVD